MGYRSFLAMMIAGTGAACVLLGYVILNVNPFESGLIGLFVFYISLYASLIGLMSLAGITFRIHIRNRQQTAFREVRIAFRHAVLLSGVAVVALILSSINWLAWWNFFILLAIIGVLEYVFLTIQESRRG